jgi:hypothetical protein
MLGRSVSPFPPVRKKSLACQERTDKECYFCSTQLVILISIYI